MPDTFASLADSPISPSRAPFAITPSDTLVLPTITKAIYVGTGGSVTVRGVDASADVLYKNVPSGSYLQVRASYVRATGTTAADLVGEA
jgi:hypothetical protein